MKVRLSQGRLVKAAVVTLAVVLPLALPAQATTSRVTATITRTLAEANDQFGGCAALLSVAPSSAGLNCANSWVTFDCAGKHIAKSSAMRMLDSAQLAFMTGRRVTVWVDDDPEKQQGNMCSVTRIDVLPAS